MLYIYICNNYNWSTKDWSHDFKKGWMGEMHDELEGRVKGEEWSKYSTNIQDYQKTNKQKQHKELFTMP